MTNDNNDISNHAYTVAMIPVLAQADGGLTGIEIGLIALAILVLLLVLYAIVRALSRPEPPTVTERRPPEDEGVVPTKDVLEDRMEVEEPVEITDDMSLAEIKRIKSARVKGRGKRRETSVEATERARKKRQEAEEAAEEAEEAAEEAEDKASEVEEAADAGQVEEAEEAIEDVEEAVEEAEEAAEDADLAADEAEEAAPLAEDIVEETDETKEAADQAAIEAQEAAKEAEEAQEAAKEAAEKAVEEQVEKAAEAAEEAAQEEVKEAAEVAEEEHKPDPPVEEELEAATEEVEKVEATEPKTLAQGLEKTRTGFIERLGSIFASDKLDEEIVDDVEEVLFTADIGPHVAQQIMQAVEESLTGDEKRDPARIWGFIRRYTSELLQAHEQPLALESAKPYVMLVVGVNGVGKTTSIGKMASKFRDQGKKVLMVAADTFRAGAVDQLAIWAERTDMPIHQGEHEADPSSVMYEGIERGIEEDTDVIICDTSGRLQTNVNLMDELAKMARVAGKALDGAPHETMLVLDANTGQNAIAQAEKFNDAVEITGITLTKLDGTARGGVILGICDQLEAPVRYIGIGESVEDLREFDADEFVDALFM